MQLSIAEAQIRFPEVVEAAVRGEELVLTRDGTPFLTLVPKPERKSGIDWEAGARWRKENGWEDLVIELPENFDDPAFSRQVLGLED